MVFKNYIKTSLLLGVLLLNGCASHVERTTLGDDVTLFNNGINIHTEMEQRGVVVTVNNMLNTEYALWVTYDYCCNERKGTTEEKIFQGNDNVKTFIIDVPIKDQECERTFLVNLKDSKGKDLYFSHLLKIRPVALKAVGGTQLIGD